MESELGPVEREALALLAARRKKGMGEYGVGIEDCGKTEEELFDEAIEEAADLLLYLLARRRRINGWLRLAAAIKEEEKDA